MPPCNDATQLACITLSVPLATGGEGSASCSSEPSHKDIMGILSKGGWQNYRCRADHETEAQSGCIICHPV